MFGRVPVSFILITLYGIPPHSIPTMTDSALDKQDQ